MTDKIKEAIAKLNKDFGEGTVVSKEHKAKSEHRDIISTGSLGLDIATGVGGLAKGTIVEVMGWESSGKSTIALNVISAAQAKNNKCLLIDGEHSFDSRYAKQLGIDVDKLEISQPESVEQMFAIALTFIQTGEVGVVVIDSQTAFEPKKAVDGLVGDSKLGLKARLMSDGVVKLVHKAAQYNTLVIVISQYREKIGVMFGSPVTTSGGNALKFYTHMRLSVSRTIEKDENGEGVKSKTKVQVSKNKLAPPFRIAEFNIVFGEGIDRMEELIDLAVEYGFIKKSGSWYSYEENKLGQGAKAVKQILKDNPALALEIEELVMEKIKENEG